MNIYAVRPSHFSLPFALFRACHCLRPGFTGRKARHLRVLTFCVQVVEDLEDFLQHSRLPLAQVTVRCSGAFSQLVG